MAASEALGPQHGVQQIAAGGRAQQQHQHGFHLYPVAQLDEGPHRRERGEPEQDHSQEQHGVSLEIIT
jgi:hypothetical protein